MTRSRTLAYRRTIARAYALPNRIQHLWVRIAVAIVWWLLLTLAVAMVFAVLGFFVVAYWVYIGWWVRLLFVRRIRYRY